MNTIQKKLGEILKEMGLVTEEQLADALTVQKKTKEFLGAILVKRGYIDERSLVKALSEKYGIPVFKLKDAYIDWELAKRFTASLILDHKCFPVQRGDYSVTFAITNPLDVWAMQKAEEESVGLKPKFVLVAIEDMEDAIARYKQNMRRRLS